MSNPDQPVTRRAIKRYPVQITVLVTEAMGARLRADAHRNNTHVSDIARTYLEAGIETGEANSAATRAGALN